MKPFTNLSKTVVALLLILSVCQGLAAQTKKTCVYTKGSGELCQAYPMADSEYCFNHNPDLPTCSGMKANKEDCTRKISVAKTPVERIRVTLDSDTLYFCWQHEKQCK